MTLTDPADVARVESKTVISTSEKRDTVPIPKEGVTGSLGRWISPDDMDKAYKERVPGCMKGKYSNKTNSWRAIGLRYYRSVEIFHNAWRNKLLQSSLRDNSNS